MEISMTAPTPQTYSAVYNELLNHNKQSMKRLTYLGKQSVENFNAPKSKDATRARERTDRLLLTWPHSSQGQINTLFCRLWLGPFADISHTSLGRIILRGTWRLRRRHGNNSHKLSHSLINGWELVSYNWLSCSEAYHSWGWKFTLLSAWMKTNWPIDLKFCTKELSDQRFSVSPVGPRFESQFGHFHTVANNHTCLAYKRVWIIPSLVAERGCEIVVTVTWSSLRSHHTSQSFLVNSRLTQLIVFYGLHHSFPASSHIRLSVCAAINFAAATYRVTVRSY
ncbi:hypothetical protein J6590_014602 [Homalodisca vitripennis]|nr:hypothetical protein J6590_014602 [Homalodisca vitripennis]